jgi:predicted CXXCH cytochrome family protein
VNNNYATIPTDCYSCHKANYTGTTNPNHIAAGFPTTCTTCHTTTSWAGAIFNHNNTPFPLTGAHVSVACNLCHINNVFAGTPTDCYSCHKTQYTGTTNPNHITAGFPTTCATCHTTTAWTGATFNHTYFPTNHGGANGVCATCHTNSANYAVFTCTNCHSKTSTDQRHNGISGYVYNSVNCYACHKNGGGGGI